MVHENLFSKILKWIICGYGRCKWEEKKEKEFNRKYFIINGTRRLSSGELSSDTTRGSLKVKNVNDKWGKRGWYEKCWFDKGGGEKKD